ncbi:DUF7257 domain-containing protein [Mycolicibacterium palauense]|uniref:DUF7257 domain-containing protein n=1 Tax=Mycolicibacterium palauense TaxID=2034511 RepID=UPI0011455139|nr:hypothetical protein [Mycolicibacterium palauense]
MGAIPSGSDPSGYDITGHDGAVVGAGLSVLANRTRENVEAAKKAEVRGQMSGYSDQVFEGVDASKGIIHAALAAFSAKLFPDVDQSGIGHTSELLNTLGKVPFLGELIEVITGVEDGDYNDLGTFFNALIAAIQAAAQAFAQMLQQVPIIGDIIEVLSGVEDGDTTDLGTWGLQIRYDIQQTIDNIVTSFFGWVGNLFDHDQAQQAMQDAASTISALSAQVTALQSNQNNQAVGGVSFLVDFTALPSGSTFGSDFTHIRTGGGGHFEIVNGVGADWHSVNDTDATDAYVYNALATATDYQKIWMVSGSAPVTFLGNSGRNEIHGRKNAAGDTYVYASMEKYRAELGCVVGGTRIIWATKTTGFSYKAQGLYALECGTIGGLRVFRLLEGSKVILTHTEVGTTSQVGMSYRGTGGLGFAYASASGTIPPGTMWAFAGGDNQPAEVTGSGARMFRADTAELSISSGTHLFPDNFFDNVYASTSDILYDFTTGKFTVSVKGWYTVYARVSLAGNTPNNLSLILYHNDAPEMYIGQPVGHFSGTRITGGGDTYYSPDYPEGIFASVSLYLDANDWVQLGYYSPSAASSLITGEGSGAKTYWGIARTGVTN